MRCPPKSKDEVPAYILTVYSLPLEGKVSAKLTDEVLPPKSEDEVSPPKSTNEVPSYILTNPRKIMIHIKIRIS